MSCTRLPVTGRGDTIYTWQDDWGQGILRDKYPHLYSFAIDKTCTISQYMNQQDTTGLFHTPLSTEAYQQLQLMNSFMNEDIIHNTNDRWSMQTDKMEFSARKTYRAMFPQGTSHPIFRYIWDNCCILRYKIFIWLVIHDRINTRNLLDRKPFYVPSIACSLCNEISEETCLHLLWDCSFAMECWDTIYPYRHRGISTLDNLLLLREEIATPFAMEIIIMGCWHIWMIRNNKIFKHSRPNINTWRIQMHKDLKLLSHRIKEKHKEALMSWITEYLS